jgi:DNA polymerase bacteriophage-type
MEEAFKQVLIYGGTVEVGKVTWNKKEQEWVPHPTTLGCVIKFSRRKMVEGGWMMIMTLPSGRSLHYLNATVDAEERISKKDGKPWTAHVLHYDGVEHSASQDASGQTKKKSHKWGRVKTYGGKLTENAVQAIARDILLYGMFQASKMGFKIFGMFHDELACEVEVAWDGLRVSDLASCMSEVPPWAKGLILGAEGYESPVYRKD